MEFEITIVIYIIRASGSNWDAEHKTPWLQVLLEALFMTTQSHYFAKCKKKPAGYGRAMG